MPPKLSLNFSLADVSLREKGDAALFAVTKNRSRVYPINFTSGEIWEAPCCHLLSPLNELHRPVHDFLLVCVCFFVFLFFCYSFCNLVRDCAQYSIKSDGSKFTNDFVFRVLCCCCCCFFFPQLACYWLLLADIKPEPQQQASTPRDTQRQECRVWFNYYFFLHLMMTWCSLRQDNNASVHICTSFTESVCVQYVSMLNVVLTDWRTLCWAFLGEINLLDVA